MKNQAFRYRLSGDKFVAGLRTAALFAAKVGILSSAFLILAPAQKAPLKAHVELTRNGHRVKDSSKVVLWLTPIGVSLEPRQQPQSEIPKLVQKDKSFHPSLLVIPACRRRRLTGHDCRCAR